MDRGSLEYAQSLHALAVRIAAQVPLDEWAEVDWDYDDEDWLRDLVQTAAAFAEWQTSGVTRYRSPRPGLTAAAAVREGLERKDMSYGWVSASDAVTLAGFVRHFESAISYVTRQFDQGVYGNPLDSPLRDEIEGTLRT